MKRPSFLRMLPQLLVCLVATIVIPSVAQAQSVPNQVTANNATGTLPYVTYGGVHENINLSTGDVNLQLPLLTLPGRNKLDLNLGISYDSKRWVLHYMWNPDMGVYDYTWDTQPPPPSLGASWHVNLPVLQTTNVDFGVRGGFSDTGCWSSFVVTMPDGSKHLFNNRAACWGYKPSTGTTSYPTFNYPLWDAQDASLMRLDTTNPADVVLYLKNGTRMHFFSNLGIQSGFAAKVADTIEDTDGNQIQINSPGSDDGVSVTINSITDTLHRVVNFSYTSGKLTSITYKDGSGTTQTISFGYRTCSLIPTFSLPAGSLAMNSCETLASVTLPNTLHYNFLYNNTFGELSQINYPTGGYTRYDYATLTNYQEWAGSFDQVPNTAADFREISARYVCRSSTGSCATEDTTTYTPTVDGTQANNSYMNVLDASGNVARFQLSMTDGTITTAPRELMRWQYTGPNVTPSALLRTTQTDYNQLFSGVAKSDSLPIRVTTTLNDTNQVTKVEYDYDSYVATAYGGPATEYYDNVIEQREYAYGTGAPGALVRKTDYTWLKTNAVNGADYTSTAIHIFDRKATEKVYDGAGNLIAQSQFEYDRYDTSANHATLQASGAVQHDSAFGTSYTTRGNVTAAQHWRNTDGVWLSTYSQFDDAGNPLKAIDFGGHATTFSFADSWSNSSCAPTSAKAYPTTVTNALTQSASSVYNSCSGTVASTTDANSQIVSNSYDLMGRLTQTNLPDSGLVTRTFNESSLPLSVTPSIKITSAANLTPPVVVDGLGRVTQSQLTSDPEGTTFIDTTFDEQGRKKTVSNPYRTGDTIYLTTYNYDPLGRVVQVIPQDGTASANNVTTTYSGNCTTVTDQTGKKRKTCTDALGRLIQVFEPDASQNLVNETDYQYDVLNNLLCVHQRGTDATADKSCTDGTVPASWRPRKFTYNSLSQLLTSTNPESGTITYTYDADGNVLTKMDARSVTTTYFYDVLHRLTKKTYSDTTPQVIYGYDGITPTGCTPPALTITNGVGRRTAMCDAAGSEAWSYDQMGRVLFEKRTTNAITKTTSYTYNFDGSLATITYPSGRVITYTPSAAGRTLSAKDIPNSIVYAGGTCGPTGDGACYAAFGGLSLLYNNGTAFSSTFYYNQRLQPCRISVKTSGTPPTQCSDTAHLGTLLDLTYDYNLSVANNGNVKQITNNLNTNRTQIYTYDEMNRTKTALTQGTSGSSCWGLDYSYDIYANLRTVALDPGRPSCSWTILNAGVDTNNRITNTGFSYDAAGNVLSDGSFNYTWDAESELKTAAGVTYTYDGDGRRAQKSSGKLYWYGATGDTLDESDASGNITDEFVFFGGKRIARRNISSGNIYYYLADHLGTARMIVQAGQTSACYDADFDPFGGEHIITNTCPQNYKFNGKERDPESNLDDFEARYYSSQFGRFHSADWSAIPAPVPYADLGNPQTLNLYAYVKNNPLNLTDPTGHQAAGALVGTGGNYMAARMRAGGSVLGCAYDGSCGGDAVFTEWELTVNGEGTGIYFDTEAGVRLYAAVAQHNAIMAQNQQTQTSQQQNQQLTYETISGGPNSKTWVIQWKLSHPTKKGGWIVQHLTGTNKSGKQIYEIWEAWKVLAKSQYTKYYPDPNDDTFDASNVTYKAQARFYEGLQLPSSFTVKPEKPTGILPYTTVNPNLPTDNATAPVDRTWTAP